MKYIFSRIYILFCFFFSWSVVVLCACICCVERRCSISHGSLVAPCYFNIFLYALLLLYLVPYCWGMCIAPVAYPAVYVFFTSNRSSTRRNPTHVSVLAHAPSIIYLSFSVILFVPFLFLSFLCQCI